MDLILFVVGLCALVLGAEALVRGASRIAGSFGISPLVVGLTIVAFGTSAPELAVTLGSAYSGKADIAIGNVVGSNIFNALFILGLSSLITPLVVDQKLVRKEVPLIIGVSLLLWALAVDGTLSRGEGLLFVALLSAYVVLLITRSLGESSEVHEEYSEAIVTHEDHGLDRHILVQILLVAGGLFLLVFGARWLVEAASGFALRLGVSELVVSLTIVAAGTSFPELATSVLAAIRGQTDIAVGNVVGSNLFNILGVLGVSAVAAPDGLPVSPQILAIDLPVMIAVAIACLPIFFTGHRIDRWEGGLFLAFYIAYSVHVVMAAGQHAWLSNFNTAMGFYVLPLTTITLVILAVRQWRTR